MTVASDNRRTPPDTCMLREHYQGRRGKPPTPRALEASARLLAQRQALQPDTRTTDSALPIAEHRDAIIAALNQHQVIVVSGETGSGKTTQLPRYALAAGFGRRGMIGHTQPRRLAARSVAARIADETGMPLGGGVGYAVRFDDQSSPDTLVRLMTDGILLNELQRDRLLLDYEVLIIDEAHERSLNIDFLLGVLALIAPKRPELKIIITSATIDHNRFAAHFGDAPVIEVSGRGYPVSTHYLDVAFNADDSRAIARTICDAVDDVLRRSLPDNAKDVLVFLPGEREIRDAERALHRSGRVPESGFEILPLYGRLSDKQQSAVFKPGRRRRIVLATNVAETSLTVPRIGAVIDSGLARVNRYSHKSRIQRLQLEPISQASANQRAGRCGRLGPGVCLRLYSEASFEERPAFTDPEILRNNLASVLLQLLSLRLGQPESFPFLDQPDSARIDDARRLLFELGALNDDGRLTRTGRTLSKLPLDPRLGRMLLVPVAAPLAFAVVVAVSAVSVQDPRQRPLESAAAADEAHSRFRDAQSDFMSMLRLWCLIVSQREKMKRREFERWCESMFLSARRIREWQEVVSQLAKQLNVKRQPVEPRILDDDASRDQIHQAIVTGLLTQIGNKEEPGIYTGVGRKRFSIHPASTLRDRTPPWVMALEIVQTRKRLARFVAPIDPAWIVKAGRHLIDYDYEAPRWQARRGRVEARRTGLLDGLVVDPPRRVNFASVDVEKARQVFILDGLVKDNVRVDAPFIQHNRQQRDAIAQLAGKTRRAVEISDQSMAQLYASHLPPRVCDAGSLKRWLRNAGNAAQKLCFSQDMLVSEQPELAPALTPDTVVLAGNRLDVAYQFAPNAKDDGASLRVPESLLPALTDADIEHSVPAYLHARIEARLRALPKAQRRQLHPIREHAERIANWMIDSSDRQPLNSRLASVLLREYQFELSPDIWASVVEAEHLKPRIVVTNDNGKTLRDGRDLAVLKQSVPGQRQRTAPKPRKDAAPKAGPLTDWPAAPLPTVREVMRGRVKLTVYPGLSFDGTHVVVDDFLEPMAAMRAHTAGTLRFIHLRFRQQFKLLRKGLIQDRRIQLLWSAFDDVGGELLIADYLDAVALYSADQPLHDIRDRDAWETLCAHVGSRLVTNGEQIRELLEKTLSAFAACREQLAATVSAYGEAKDDVDAQMHALVFPGFLSATPSAHLEDLPRYLLAASQRLERIRSNPERDSGSMAMVMSLQKRLATISSAAVGPNQAAALQAFRWSIEELRVSLFAQTLGTREKVSLRRLEKRWDQIVRMQD